MFTNMNHVKTEYYSARNTEYELSIYLVNETGVHNLYISNSGVSVGNIFSAPSEVIKDAKLDNNIDIVEELITIVKQDIEKNESDHY